MTQQRKPDPVIAVQRFIKRKGRLSAPHLEEIVAAIAAVVEYPSVEP